MVIQGMCALNHSLVWAGSGIAVVRGVGSDPTKGGVVRESLTALKDVLGLCSCMEW